MTFIKEEYEDDLESKICKFEELDNNCCWSVSLYILRSLLGDVNFLRDSKASIVSVEQQPCIRFASGKRAHETQETLSALKKRYEAKVSFLDLRKAVRKMVSEYLRYLDLGVCTAGLQMLHTNYPDWLDDFRNEIAGE